jgi:hypothetical protein
MFRLPLPVLSLRRRLVSLVRSLLGRAQYRVGALAPARRSFERVLELMGDDFVAYVHLGLIARGNGDRIGAAREFDNARRTDPERYARLRLPREIDAAALEPLLAWDRSFWSPVPAVPEPPPGGEGGQAGRRRADPWADTGWGLLAEDETAGKAFPGGVQAAEGGDRHSRHSHARPPHRGDFRDAAEARRFRDRRPIVREEIASVDLDALVREFQGPADGPGPSPG